MVRWLDWMGDEIMGNTLEDHVAYEHFVAEKLKNDGPYFDFEGNNCGEFDENEYRDEPCLGWDGMSTRCQCGNRRVSWVLSDDGSYVYAAAN